MTDWQQLDPALLKTFAAIAGLLIGSFLNVCIYRLPRLTGRSVVRPRSRCWRCRAPIAWYDNIPIVSWIILRGRCRHCRRMIPIRYPLVELMTSIAFVICVGSLGLSLATLKYVVFSSILIVLVATDFERHILPDEFTIGGTVVGLIFSLLVPMERYFISILLPHGLNDRLYSLSESAFGAFVSSGAIWLMAYVYGRLRDIDALGFGDVKMIAMIGAFTGLQGALETMILGSVIGAIVGLIYIRAAGKNWRTYQIPFGSFLGFVALFIALYGQVIHGH